MPACRAEVPRPRRPVHDAVRPRTPAVKEMPAQPDEARHYRLRMITAVGEQTRIAGTARTTIPSAIADSPTVVGTRNAPRRHRYREAQRRRSEQSTRSRPTHARLLMVDCERCSLPRRSRSYPCRCRTHQLSRSSQAARSPSVFPRGSRAAAGWPELQPFIVPVTGGLPGAGAYGCRCAECCVPLSSQVSVSPVNTRFVSAAGDPSGSVMLSSVWTPVLSPAWICSTVSLQLSTGRGPQLASGRLRGRH